jgi:F420-non-reducing hydrogenase iron-sulfur subunit
VTEANVFEPRILGFLCNWCSYAGADLAGVSRFQYPPTIRVIRVMCSGRVDPALVLRAFGGGIDGVMILGCHPGDCHYATGNYYAKTRAKVLSQLIELAGLDPGRLTLDWVSAGEGERFASLVTQFTERIKAAGPLGESEGLSSSERAVRLAAAARVVHDERLRWLMGRERELLAQGDVYGREVVESEYDELLKSTLATEYLRQRLLLLTDERPLSVKELAEQVDVAPKDVLRHVAALEQAGMMAMVGIEGLSPKYRGT